LIRVDTQARILSLVGLLSFMGLSSVCLAKEVDSKPGEARTILFLGDSITYSGQFIEYVETVLRLQDRDFQGQVLNLGLPSETVSQLSEPGHADGRFPRPAVQERLGRVLEKVKPDLVVACYGMNDGIYYPFSQERFAKFQKGIEELRMAVDQSGARLVLLTPPVFDSKPIQQKTLPAGLEEYRQPFEGYDDVLDRYAHWLINQREKCWEVVDLHGPLRQALDAARKQNPDFHFARDGVHLDADGHWIIACEVLKHWQVKLDPARSSSAKDLIGSYPQGLDLLQLVQERQRLQKDAWLSATGHQRPGMKPGLPLGEAEEKATSVESEIKTLLNP